MMIFRVKRSISNNNGFTMIELVVVIIMLAIMATTILPKFFTSTGFQEYTYRAEIITKLRSIQLRAMQQTNSSTCQLIQVDLSIIGLLATTPNATTCETTYAGDTTKIIIDSDSNVSFSISENLSNFSFSSLGKPLGCIAVNPCEITLTIAGESSIGIKINSEGYIYAL